MQQCLRGRWVGAAAAAAVGAAAAAVGAAAAAAAAVGGDGGNCRLQVRKMARVLQRCGADVSYEEVEGKVHGLCGHVICDL